MNGTESSYEKWFNAIFAVQKINQKGTNLYLDPEKIKPVTITVPAWVAARMDYKCDLCGWPIYVINIGPSQYHYCTNPECSHSKAFDSISAHLQDQDRIVQERRERIRARKAEKAVKEEEAAKLDQLIEFHVRRMFHSFGMRARKTPRRIKKT